MKLWDAHCHLSKPEVFQKIDSWLKMAESHGVFGFALGGIDPEDWKRQADLKAMYPGQFRTSIGLHPWLCKEIKSQEQQENFITEFVKFSQNEIQFDAFGELGLDHSSAFDKQDQAIQANLFNEQLQRVVVQNKPLILHVVGAHPEAQATIKSFYSTKNCRGMVHSFSGSMLDLKNYLDLGLSISLGPSVHRASVDMIEVIKNIPLEAILIESDAPDQGSKDPGLSLIAIAEKIALHRGNQKTPRELLQISTRNLHRLFGESVN